MKKQKVDDVTKKRITGLVQMFRQGAEISLGILQEITIPLDEVPPDEDEEPGEGEGDDEDGGEGEGDDDEGDGDETAGGEG
jgi:hypothetical protein